MSDETWVPFEDQTEEDPEPTPEPEPTPAPEPEQTNDERLLAAGWRKVNGAWER